MPTASESSSDKMKRLARAESEPPPAEWNDTEADATAEASAGPDHSPAPLPQLNFAKALRPPPPADPVVPPAQSAAPPPPAKPTEPTASEAAALPQLNFAKALRTPPPADPVIPPAHSAAPPPSQPTEPQPDTLPPSEPAKPQGHAAWDTPLFTLPLPKPNLPEAQPDHTPPEAVAPPAEQVKPKGYTSGETPLATTPLPKANVPAAPPEPAASPPPAKQVKPKGYTSWETPLSTTPLPKANVPATPPEPAASPPPAEQVKPKGYTSWDKPFAAAPPPKPAAPPPAAESAPPSPAQVKPKSKGYTSWDAPLPKADLPAAPRSHVPPASSGGAETSSTQREFFEQAFEPEAHPAPPGPAMRRVKVDASGMPRPSQRSVPTQPQPPSASPTARPSATPAQPGAAHLRPSSPAQVNIRGSYPPPPIDATQHRQAPAPRPRRSFLGWVWNFIRVAALVFAFICLGGMIILIYGYWSIARTLPSVDNLRARASQFQTASVYDAQGNKLSDIMPQQGNRTRVPIDKISPYLIAATIATEDRNFYTHPGFDPIGIVRALWQNLRAGGTVSGASTITQQLVRTLILSPEERAQRTNLRKIREIILAAEVTRRYSRDEILELYLNENNYGNLAYGIEAAAQTYFHKPASDLNLAEASFLAGLPQAPGIYDIYTDPDAVYLRQRDVLLLMVEASPIAVSHSQPVKVEAKDVTDAISAILNTTFTPPKNTSRFPHWVNYVRQTIETLYGAQAIYGSGYKIYTTLDADLQTAAEQAVAEQIATLADRHVTNGALVAIRPTTGEILAMVGSDDYNDPVDGQINMAIRPRQPGSSIKPLTYAQTFERGWTPATLLWDVPTEFPDGSNPPYVPVNYDGRFHGPTLVRTALANSYNIPAVKALQSVGIYGDTGFIKFAEQFGISTLTRNDFGLSLTLGGGEVPLLEMTNAYAALANTGRRVYPFAITKITDLEGKILCQQPLSPGELKSDPLPCQPPPDNWGQPLVSPETAFLISDILADNAARTPAFGPNSPLLLSFPAAVKTGTTNDYYDNWTIGYTPDLVTGVWVGNADRTPMVHTTGVTGAAPIWHAFMESALGGGRATPFARPAGIIEKTICGLSGAEPGEACPAETLRTELFAAKYPPLTKDQDLRQKIFVDPFTQLRQHADCAKYYQADQLYNQEKMAIAIDDLAARKWLTEDPNGQAWATQYGLRETGADGQPKPLVWAPTDTCQAGSPHPLINFVYPSENAVIPGGIVTIQGQAGATADFGQFVIEYGLSRDPGGWGQLPVLGGNTLAHPETANLAEWNTGDIDGDVTLRIIVYSLTGGSAEARVHFVVHRPTSTPLPTNQPTSTPTPTYTPTPTSTVLATGTATATLAITNTPGVSVTPTPTETPLVPEATTEAPTPTPTETPPPPEGTTETPPVPSPTPSPT